MNDFQTPTYLIGLDLGTKRDFTALSVLQQRFRPTGATMPHAVGFSLARGTIYETVPVMEALYDVIHLDRWRGKGYGAAVPALETVVQQVRQAAYDAPIEADRYRSREPALAILVDHTGVGIAVVESIRAAGITCIGITITGGDTVTRDGQDIRVPKRELAARTAMLLESRRLRIAAELELAPVVTSELENFQVKKAVLTGHDSYGAGADWRESHHDDLVLSISMAAWYGEEIGTGDTGWDQVAQAMVESTR